LFIELLYYITLQLSLLAMHSVLPCFFIYTHPWFMNRTHIHTYTNFFPSSHTLLLIINLSPFNTIKGLYIQKTTHKTFPWLCFPLANESLWKSLLPINGLLSFYEPMKLERDSILQWCLRWKSLYPMTILERFASFTQGKIIIFMTNEFGRIHHFPYLGYFDRIFELDHC
jgi:hypothetical protein